LFPAGINVLTSTITSTLTIHNSTIRIGGNEFVVNLPSKTFVIDHPQDASKHLVHACLEGPEAGVYYRGKACLSNSGSVEIDLPPYAMALADDFTIQVTPIWNGTGSALRTLNVSEVHDGKFSVYGEAGSFYWIVHGRRATIDVEPRKDAVCVRGDGPYRWISS
jgi:hypothetical protein